MENTITTSQNNIQAPTLSVKHGLTGKERAIIILLGHVFVFVLFFVTWDLFGKKALCPVMTTNSANTTQQTTSTTQPKQDKQTEKAVNVDSSLYATCTSKISDEKVYKDCCDSLSADDSVKKACKKVVDDKNQTNPKSNSTTTPSTN